MSLPTRKLVPIRLGHPRPPWLLSEVAVLDWAESAAVCLKECGHAPTVAMTVAGFEDVEQVLVEAPAVTEAMRRTHQNLKSAAEDGAIAIVASLIHELTEEIFINQADDHSGIDYWLCHRDHPHFQQTTRIEISGILAEKPNNTVVYRIDQKAKRLMKYDDDAPAKIAVVEFSEPKTVVEDHRHD